jgi:hypothetical protein
VNKRVRDRPLFGRVTEGVRASASRAVQAKARPGKAPEFGLGDDLTRSYHTDVGARMR